jgi:Uncharacterized conserved protein
MKRFLWVVGLLALSLVGYLTYIAAQIEKQSFVDEARAADVIVIMGAAEYHGRPSPVFRARLDHGLDLYHRKLASRILTTGGAGGDPLFTEGEVGRAYLITKGVPSEDIIVEKEAESTVHSVAAVGEIMRRMGLNSLILVSDGYHIFRAKKMLEFRGLTVYGSPRPSRPRSDFGRWKLYFRQAVAYLLWSIGITI